MKRKRMNARKKEDQRVSLEREEWIRRRLYGDFSGFNFPGVEGAWWWCSFTCDISFSQGFEEDNEALIYYFLVLWGFLPPPNSPQS
ncbi:hypothetical protein GmHk_17G048680 [Glycine max]|nr:hypothetical protein GmHk_17G048680 [Glycine max]